MTFLTKDELKTHMPAELIDAVSRGDDTVVESAIDGAISEAKGYLAAYSVVSVFAATGDSRNQLLLIFVKDIAVWHFINLANPGIDYESRQERYKQALAWLKGVQKGNISPDLPADESDDQPGIIIYGSNPKRSNHY